MRYIPQPIDISDVYLPEELNTLVEAMARNVHEVWAQTRIEQGWIYGTERNDDLKQHPCLIPYEQLTEEEKEHLNLMYARDYTLLKDINYFFRALRKS